MGHCGRCQEAWGYQQQPLDLGPLRQGVHSSWVKRFPSYLGAQSCLKMGVWHSLPNPCTPLLEGTRDWLLWSAGSPASACHS